jgi:hypothetical protein
LPLYLSAHSFATCTTPLRKVISLNEPVVVPPCWRLDLLGRHQIDQAVEIPLRNLERRAPRPRRSAGGALDVVGPDAGAACRPADAMSQGRGRRQRRVVSACDALTRARWAWGPVLARPPRRWRTPGSLRSPPMPPRADRGNGLTRRRP